VRVIFNRVILDYGIGMTQARKTQVLTLFVKQTSAGRNRQQRYIARFADSMLLRAGRGRS
jgi:hypothetical protein